jgi:hypothetical protein
MKRKVGVVVLLLVVEAGLLGFVVVFVGRRFSG